MIRNLIDTGEGQDESTSTSLQNHVNSNEIIIITENSPYWKTALRILKLAVPMALSYSFSFSLVAISIMVPRTAPDEQDQKDYLAATPLIISSLQTIMLMASSTLYAMSIEGGKRLGELRRLTREEANDLKIARQGESIRYVFRSGVAFSAVVTPIVMGGMFFSDSILKYVLGQNADVSHIVSQYLRINSIATPANLARMVTEQMLFIYGKTLPAMLISLTSFGFSTVLAWFLGLGPAKLGVNGIAIAYTVDSYLLVLAYSVFLALHPDYRSINLFSLLHWDRRFFTSLLDVLKTGLPITMFLGSQLVIDQLLVLMAGWQGTDSLSALSYATQLAFFTVIPIIAFGQSITQEVSRAIGESRFAYARRVARLGLPMSMAILAPVAGTFLAFPQWLIKFSTRHTLSTTLRQTASRVIRVASGATIAATANYGMVQVMRASNQRLVPSMLSIAALAIGLGLAYGLGFGLEMGAFGLEIGATIGLAMAVAVLLPFWLWFTRERYFEKVKRQDMAPPVKQSWFHRFFSAPTDTDEEDRCSLLDSREYADIDDKEAVPDSLHMSIRKNLYPKPGC